MILEKLQNITKELDKSIQSKSIIKLPVPGNLVNDIRESLELIKKHPDQEKNITEELINLHEKLIGAGLIVQHDCWDSFKHSSANSEPLSDKYDVVVAYKNLSIIVEALKLLNSVNRNKEELNQITSLQKKMKEELEKIQQEELEKKAKEEFGKYIKNGTIDAVSIKKDSNQDLLYTIIKLKEDNKGTDIQVSEFLNSDFCKDNKIADFLILNGNQEKIIHGFIKEEIRYYDLGTTAQYGIKFNWYVGERKCSITLGANSDGSIRIISDRPTDTDLEKNEDVKIKVGNAYLSLAEAVKTCRQQEDPSSTVKQASTTECFRQLVNTLS